MSNKQVFITIVGGICVGCRGRLLLFAFPTGLLQRDAGDDGFPMVWVILCLLSGIVGLALSAKWVRKYYPEQSR